MPVKWLDNVLSHHRVNGVSRARQGVARRLTPRAVLTLELALRLTDTLSMSVSRALQVAELLIQNTGSKALADVGKGVTLTIDIDAIDARLMERLADAVEVAPIPRRGRPPQSRS